jgi:threonine synthase
MRANGVSPAPAGPVAGTGTDPAPAGPASRFAVRPRWPGIIEAYRDRMPVDADWPVITLQEGGTPLLPAPYLSDRVGAEVYLKVDGANPTGSFKDRGMTVAVTVAAAHGAQGVLCASTGNTSASAAAYAARAGLTCAVLVPQGKIALGKLAQAVAHGAKILQIEGNFDACLELARKTANEYPVIELVNSVNPTRIAGQASAAYEICDELGRAPDVHCLPVGNAGNITAYWAGYRAYKSDGLITGLPRMFGFQAAGAAPLVHGEPVLHPETIATAIRIGAPASWAGAVTARDESRGLFAAVTDEEILSAHRLLSAREAVFTEPASAASVAGLLQVSEAGLLGADAGDLTVVCTVTGHGLKDADTALRAAPDPVVVRADADAVARALELA